MTWITGDRIKETCATTGTGDLTLGGAVAGFRTFAAGGCANLDEVDYIVAGATEWEAGRGRWNTGGTLTRIRVYASSNAGALVNFTETTKEIWIDFPASRGLLPITARVQVQDLETIPAGAAVYSPRLYKIPAAKRLMVSAGAELRVG